MRIYGTMQCPDCVACCKDLEMQKVDFTFCEFADDLKFLKEFLKIRDAEPIFDAVKQGGKIGIPCILHDDGTVSLTWK